MVFRCIIRRITTGTFPFIKPGWPVFFEDNHLLVIYKPAGLLVQADATGDTDLLSIIKNWLKKKYSKPGNVFLGIVHRLDRPVAGLVLFCKTSKAAARMSEQFRMHTTQKKYWAIVNGQPDPPVNRLVHFLKKKGHSSIIINPSNHKSKEARLSYQVLNSSDQKSLVEINLETGRHHQIRVQMASIECPILGDLRYGATSPLPAKQIALLAKKLTFTHPISKKIMTFTCSPPIGWPWPETEANPLSPIWNWSDMRLKC